MTSATDDLDMLLDEVEPESEETEENDSNVTEESEENESETSEEDQILKDVLKEIPEGYTDVASFARLLTMGGKGEGFDFPPGTYGYVTPQNVYQAVKAKNHVPHVVVSLDGSVLRAYIPIAEGINWWTNKPTRGEGTSKGGRTTVELQEDAKNAISGAVYAAARAQMWYDKLNKANNVVGKYRTWLAAAGMTAEEIEDFVSGARQDAIIALETKPKSTRGRKPSQSK